MMPQAYIAGKRIPFHATRLPVRCRSCGKVECDCHDMRWGGIVPPKGAA